MDGKLIIKNGAIEEVNSLVSSLSPFKTVVITDENVEGLWLEQVLSQIDAEPIVIPSGEKNKNIKTVIKIWDKLIDINFTRESLLIGLGGGVITDITGFVSSTFMRGTNFGFIPTTLLSQIDASIGGKTGFNFKGKNMIGTFKQPNFILVDPNTLQTLPDEEIKNAFGEVVKYGLLNVNIYNLLEKLDKLEINIELIKKCVNYKTDIVEEDVEEHDKRRLLNFGHTVGHSVEKLSNYTIKHGSAISIGMYVNSKISERFYDFDSTITKRLLNKFELPITHNFSPEKILSYMKNDKKRWYDEVILVLPKGIGDFDIRSVDKEMILEALRETKRGR